MFKKIKDKNWFDLCQYGNIDEIKQIIDKNVGKYDTRKYSITKKDGILN